MCQNCECNLEKNMLDECRLVCEVELLFVKGVWLLERVGVKEVFDVFYECLWWWKIFFYVYNKDLVEIYDVIVRYQFQLCGKKLLLFIMWLDLKEVKDFQLFKFFKRKEVMIG